MANKVLVSETNLTNIGNAIRSKNNSTEAYTPAEMAEAIEELEIDKPINIFEGELGVDWHLTTYSSLGEIVNVIAEGNNIRIGQKKDIWVRSYNEEEWTNIDLPFAKTSKIVFGKNKFIAMPSEYSATARIAFSIDGLSWTIKNLATLTGQSLYLNNIIFENNIFVIAGNRYIYTSSDGENWVSSFSDTSYEDVIYFQDRFYAVDYDGRSYQSENSTDWSNKFNLGEGSKRLFKFKDRLIVFTYQSRQSATFITYTTDGTNWITNFGKGKYIPDKCLDFLTDDNILYGDIGYYTINGVGYYSKDGDNWITIDRSNSAVTSTISAFKHENKFIKPCNNYSLAWVSQNGSPAANPVTDMLKGKSYVLPDKTVVEGQVEAFVTYGIGTEDLEENVSDLPINQLYIVYEEGG